MESLGDKIKSAREAKGYSYEHVGRETNIARRYLEALEGEDFARFPGEPYLLGFLRNYGEYLGIDTEELLSLYKAIKIQEQPTPVEQLLKPSPGFPKALIILMAGLPALLIIALIAYFTLIRPPAPSSETDIPQLPMEYQLEGASLERRFYRGDTVIIPLGNEQYKVELQAMTDPLTLTIPGGKVVLSLSESANVDLNGDGIADVRVTLSDWEQSVPQAGALIRFDAAAAAADPGLAAVPGETMSAGLAIFNSTNAYPFTLQARFQGYCMFRWEIDRRERNERYFSRNDELNVQAQNGMRLWISNAAAVKIQLIGAGRTIPLELGAPGEVVVIDLRWIRDNDGRFRLNQYRLE
ncbi:MAG: helix-turn-helix domain-containing protein [Treponema sp.]|jgi:cytoskeletal protein RodZ|nr:helix-turn-helix domain-containing protein [Treponema sp.]